MNEILDEPFEIQYKVENGKRVPLEDWEYNNLVEINFYGRKTYIKSGIVFILYSVVIIFISFAFKPFVEKEYNEGTWKIAVWFFNLFDYTLFFLFWIMVIEWYFLIDLFNY